MKHSVSLWRIALSETRFEFLKMIRMPGFALPTIAFPLTFYIIFAVLMNTGQGMERYMLAGYAAFGIIGPALFGFGVGVASERSAGWLLLKHASPMPPAAYVIAKMGMAMLFAVVIIASMFTAAALGAGVRMEPVQWAILAAVLLFGTVPFCAFGLAIGFGVPSQSAVAVVNLVYLPMSALSGLWFPLQQFPAVLGYVAWLLPPFHLVQLALKAVDMDAGHPWWWHALALTGFSLAFIGLALRWFRADDMAYAAS